MGLFSSILEKIGIGRAHAEPDSTAPTTPPEASTGGAGAPTTPAVDQVDVAAKLDGMANNHPKSSTGAPPSSTCSSCWAWTAA